MKTLSEALDDVLVHPPSIRGDRGDIDGLEDWYAVSTAEAGIVAYFATERAACYFRLALINDILNGGASCA